MKELLSKRIKSTEPSFVKSLLAAAADPGIISFAGGLPNPISFPQEALLESMERVVREKGDRAFQYSVTDGIPELRQYIAERYNKKHGLSLTAENIVITTGSQQALDLIGRLLIDEGDGVVVEDPSYLAALQAFDLDEPRYYPVSLTEEGLDVEELKEAMSHEPKLVYTIPNFQNPTGLTYSAENRLAVYDVIKDHNTVLIEDDPYGELRYGTEQLPYIGLGKYPNTLVLGSFSKTVTPGMRLGFIISENKFLLDQICAIKEASDLHTNVFAQYVIADYLTHNDFESHIAKIKDLYKTQAQAMVDAIGKHFPAGITHTRPDGGMFLWVTLPEGMSAVKLFPKAIEKKVAFVPGDPFYVNKKDVNTMRLNYTNVDAATIEEGIRRLGELLKQM